MLRGCTGSNLYELYLYIDIKNNNYPDFIREIETTFTLTVGKVFEYKLPPIVDKENNDESEVFIKPMHKEDGSLQPFPDFLVFNNITNTLIFRPHDKWHRGHTFYFQLIVKEKNSDIVQYPYYCTVIMLGEVLTDEMEFDYVDVRWKMFGEGSDPKYWVDKDSKTGISFNKTVNTTFIADHWDEMFDMYVMNVSSPKKLKAE